MHHRTAFASPCFRTNAAGDILLQREWPELLASLAAWGEWCLQTRHAYARIVARAPLPAWLPTEARDGAHDPAGELHLAFAHWHHAIARLRLCSCCDSPGYVEFINSSGLAVLQCRAPADRRVEELATIPARHAAAGLAPMILPRGTPALVPVFARSACPRLPATQLPGLLESLGRSDIAVLFRLQTADSDHRRLFTPESVTVESGVLTAADTRHHSLQLVLPAAHSLVLETTVAASLLHVVAADDTLLLTLAPAPHPTHAAAWHHALAALFPHPAQP